MSTRSHAPSTTPIGIAAILVGVLSSACIINVDTHKERTGRYVSATTLQQIVPGRTQDYVRALLGEPTTRTVIEGSTEIWKWNYSETERSQSGLIFVFSGDTTETIEGATYVEFLDGLVQKTWQD